MIDTSKFELVDSEIGLVDKEDDKSRITFINEAYHFIARHSWCTDVEHAYLCEVWDGILAIMYFEIRPTSPDVDDSVWVIVGDIPPAYLDILTIANPRKALLTYTEIVEEWCDAIDNGESVEKLMPMYVRFSTRTLDPTSEMADLIRKRAKFYREYLLPELEPG